MTKDKKSPKNPKQSKEKDKDSSAKKQKLKGVILIFIGLIILTFVGYFLFNKLFRAQELAKLLPAPKTIAVLEVNIDKDHSQTQKFYELLNQYSVYQSEGIIALVNTVLPVDYQTELEPWLGRKIGLAILEKNSDATNEIVEAPSIQNTFNTILFIESKDHQLALQSMQNRTIDGAEEEVISNDYNGKEIYEFAMSQKLNFTFINNYLVVTDSKQALTSFLDDYTNSEKPVERLNVNENYRKVANNLPQGGLIFGYVNLSKTIDMLHQDPTFISQKGQDLLALSPFINIFKAEGISVFAENDKFVAQTFVSIDNDALDGESYITFSEKYQGELLSLANENPIFMAGGHDLTKELNRIEDIFKSGTKTPALLFEGAIEAQKEKYFGKDINLQNDIYPLFKGEYLLAMEGSFEKPVVSLMLELQDNSASVSKFDKVVNEFIKESGIFSPHVQEFELPDGTIGKEIVASPEKIDKTTGKYQNITITSLKLGETGIAIHYAMLDDIVAMSNKEENLKTIIDRYERNIDQSFTTNQYYTNTIQKAMRSADQLMHIKIGALTEMLGLNENENIAPYFAPFNNITITKNFFKDGISTIYLIDVL